MKFALFSAMLLAASTGACADPVHQDDLNWLQVMAFAAHQTDYSGTFIYQYNDHVESMRITHVVDRNGEHGRLESLDGPRREIIRHNDQVWCYVGKDKLRVGLHQGEREFPALLPQQLSLLNANYRIRPAEEGRLAGFHAHAIFFLPRDNLRYAHKMWADSNSGLLLKSEVQDERGNIIEQYAFTQLSIGGDIDRKWIDESPEMPGQKAARSTGTNHGGPAHFAQNPPATEVVPVNSGWKVDAMPEGFRKVAEVRRLLRGKDAPVVQMSFSDGLAGISVFIEKADSDEDDHAGLTSHGLTQVYSKVVDGHLITVVGEVPPGTVIQVADSVRNGGEQ